MAKLSFFSTKDKFHHSVFFCSNYHNNFVNLSIQFKYQHDKLLFLVGNLKVFFLQLSHQKESIFSS